jgi:hypothetical protein
MSKLGNHNGALHRPGQPRASLAAILPKTPSAVSVHAKEIMAQLIPMRQGFKPAAVAEEAFNLARAFAAEEAKTVDEGDASPAPADSATASVDGAQTETNQD